MSYASSAEIGAIVYEADIATLQYAMAVGQCSAQDLVRACLDRIAALDHAGPQVRSVLELNPAALAIAAELDQERAAGNLRGPLHGIPVLLKDNIDTADEMLTTAGSLALVGSRVTQDATVAQKLRAAGAVLLGKTNLSEWANFRSAHSSSGWSGRGRQTRNPHVLDRTPCGSSSGSAAAVAASLCVVALGTETDGSIACPSSICGVVGIKPTVGLTSRAGVIPIAATQDTVGPHARSVADAVAVLAAIAGPDPRDPATASSAGQFPSDYAALLDPQGLRGARIGVLRGLFSHSQAFDRSYQQSLDTLAAQGAILIEVTLESSAEAKTSEWQVLLYEFKDGLQRYLAQRVAGPNGEAVPRTLADIIAFNHEHAAEEMPYFAQETFLAAQALGGLDSPEYLQALATSRDTTRAHLDTLLASQQLDALVAPTRSPAGLIDLINGDYGLGGSSGPAARAGYPLITVPSGFMHGLPIGLSFIGTAYSEPTLIRLAYAFEQASMARRPPSFLPTLDLP
jgi:amidase